MIILGKNKVDERYNIDDNGIITDLNGNVITLEKNLRPRFKGVHIHQIQMWTKKGWRDPEEWAIHHIDKDPTNNNINNLIYMTRSDHQRLHMLRNKLCLGRSLSEEHKKILSNVNKNKIVSEETRKKMSINNCRYWKGKHHPPHSEETKKKMSEARKLYWQKKKAQSI